jgi:predicted AAA+ superfamily ATPase
MKYRFLTKHLPSEDKKKLVLLTGARQTGKTILSQYTYPDLHYLNLDSPENREFIRNVTSFQWDKSIGNVIIDESQKEPIVFEKVKYAFDSGLLHFSLLTGSSQILLLKKIRESLAGRISLYELWPLMMSELYYERDEKSISLPILDKLLSGYPVERVCNETVSELLPVKDEVYLNIEKHMLTWGGMPALLSLEEHERWKWLRDYTFTYLERDLSDLARLSDLEPFKKFQKLAALRSGQLLNYSELASDTSISVDTARRYLEYLKISYQAILIQPYYKNLTSSVVKSPKLYWTDIGILRYLCGFKTGVTGSIYETMVMAEILKWNNTMQKEANIFFYRTRTGMELDALIETKHGLIGIEIKSRDTVNRKDMRILKKIAEAIPDKWQGGIIIYQGKKIEKIDRDGSNIWAIPSRRLFIP